METLTNYSMFVVCMAVVLASGFFFARSKTYNRWFHLLSCFGFAILGIGTVIFPVSTGVGIIVIVVAHGGNYLTRWIMDETEKTLSKWDALITNN